MTIGRADITKLTYGKATVNTAIRWLPFFLPILAVAYGTTTATLALLLGLAEAAGLSTLFVGRWLDAGRERLVIVLALVTVAVSSALALVGSIWLFAAALLLLGAASGFVTVGGHAWISARVRFERRARFIGIFEMSWATALVVGVPVVALLIDRFNWRAPFIAVAIAALGGAALIGAMTDGEGNQRRPLAKADKTPITTDAWMIIALAAMIALAGLTTVAVVGTWLDLTLGVSTGGVGLVAISFGLAELTATSSSSVFADRLGKRRTIQASVLVTLAGLAIIATAGNSLFVGVVGLIIFFLGFEYSIVTSFSLVSEAMPKSRGRVMGVSNAVSTGGRGIGVGSSGYLYDRFDIGGPVTVSVVAAVIALVLLALIGKRRSDL